MARPTKLTPATPLPAAAPEAVLPPFDLPRDMMLDAATFAGYMRLVERLGRRTGLKVHVSQADHALEQGDIFLFNHFTRFETVVAPYIIHRETGKMARSVAYAGLFHVNDMMSRILHQSGGVPNNLQRLLPFLAEEILRGRKVIIFPEGGLVKDKNVLDANGDLKMWSGVAEKVRKPHRGAAVLALMLDLAKRRIRMLFDSQDTVALSEWCERLGLSLDALREAAAKPTLIVPANITFYPMRTNPNLLLKGLETFAGPQGARARDEITIEGNLLLRPTDMDVRFGVPISAMDGVQRLHTAVLDHALASTRTMDDVFALKDASGGLLDGYMTRFVSRQVDHVREIYARKMYLGTTLNINHLVATLVRVMAERGQWEMAEADFHKVLYVALKALQQRENMHLHPTLSRPEHYARLLEGKSRGFVGFLEACTRSRLLKKVGGVYRLSRRVQDVHDLQDIRLENPVQVHANEARPIQAVREVLAEALGRVDRITAADIAQLRFDDMVREHAGQRYRFGKKAPLTVIGAENMHTGRPYLLLPELVGRKRRKVGVVLVHGFATSPAELRAYGDHLREEGSVVLGVRLPGHGTSPLDLEVRTRKEWLAEVRNAYEIVAALADEVVIVGFSTGGALSLLLAQEKLPKLVRVASVAAPLLVQDKNMRWLPLGMALRAVLGCIPPLRDVLRFYDYDRDGCAGAVYPHVPVTALNELRLVIGDMRRALPRVEIPALIVQGLLDHTVQAKSAAMIYNMLGSAKKALRWIAGGPHALVGLNFGATWEILDAFVAGEDLTGNAGGAEHKILAEPLRRPNKATPGPLIRKAYL